jgi:hypothetical protein
MATFIEGAEIAGSLHPTNISGDTCFLSARAEPAEPTSYLRRGVHCRKLVDSQRCGFMMVGTLHSRDWPKRDKRIG